MHWRYGLHSLDFHDRLVLHLQVCGKTGADAVRLVDYRDAWLTSDTQISHQVARTAKKELQERPPRTTVKEKTGRLPGWSDWINRTFCAANSLEGGSDRTDRVVCNACFPT